MVVFSVSLDADMLESKQRKSNLLKQTKNYFQKPDLLNGISNIKKHYKYFSVAFLECLFYCLFITCLKS